MTFTTLVAYGSFGLAEHFHCRGCLSTDGRLGCGQLPLLGCHFRWRSPTLDPFWEYVAFVANSLIFLLIGAQEAQQRFKGLWLPVLGRLSW